MKKLIVIKSDTYASGITGITDMRSLATGSIAVFQEYNMALVSGTLPVMSAYSKRLYIALGRGTTEDTYVSEPIVRANFQWSKTAATAAVDKIMVLGHDGTNAGTDLAYPATLVAGTVASIQIIDQEKSANDKTMYHSFSHLITASDTKTTVTADLTAQINAKATCPCTAAVSSATSYYGITLTAKNASTAGGNFYDGYMYTASCMDIILNATVIEGTLTGAGTAAIINGVYYDASTTVTLNTKLVTGATTTARAGTKGLGTSTQLAELEAFCSTEEGHTDFRNAAQYNTWKLANKIVAGTSYTTYCLVSKETNQFAPMKHSTDLSTQLYIAVPTSYTTAIAALDLILAVI